MAGEMTMSGEAPKMFRIKDASDTVKAFRVSKDAVLAAAVFGSDEIHIYRVRKPLIKIFVAL
jgi:imidazole glycerol phosphate synthase subunit HisF